MNSRFELPTLMRFAVCRLTKFKEQFWSFTEHRDGKRVNRTREKTKTEKTRNAGRVGDAHLGRRRRPSEMRVGWNLRRQRINRVGGKQEIQVASATPSLAVADAFCWLRVAEIASYTNFEWDIGGYGFLNKTTHLGSFGDNHTPFLSSLIIQTYHQSSFDHHQSPSPIIIPSSQNPNSPSSIITKHQSQTLIPFSTIEAIKMKMFESQVFIDRVTFTMSG